MRYLLIGFKKNKFKPKKLEVNILKVSNHPFSSEFLNSYIKIYYCYYDYFKIYVEYCKIDGENNG